MSFYNIENEEVSEELILAELIGFYQSLGSNGRTRVDDFEEGSEVRTLLEVLSHLAYNILEEQNRTLSSHFINTAEGEYLDLLGANPNVNLERSPGTTATGLVKFTLPEVAVGEVEIPAETVVSTDDIDYTTIEDAYISIGSNYTYVPVECSVDGVDGNCNSGEIRNCELPDFTVTNEESLTDGSDYEDDEDYRQRLLEYIRTDNFGSRGYYENIILNIDGVHDIIVNSESTANIAYIINTNNLSNKDSVYSELITYFSDNNNYVVGHNLDLLMSRLHNLSFTVTVPSDSTYTEDDIKDIFNCYFHGGEVTTYPAYYEGLDMGTEVSTTIITEALYESFPDLIFTITDIHNVYDGTDTGSFSFVDTDGSNSYSLEQVEVVFE